MDPEILKLRAHADQTRSHLRDLVTGLPADQAQTFIRACDGGDLTALTPEEQQLAGLLAVCGVFALLEAEPPALPWWYKTPAAEWLIPGRLPLDVARTITSAKESRGNLRAVLQVVPPDRLARFVKACAAAAFDALTPDQRRMAGRLAAICAWELLGAFADGD